MGQAYLLGRQSQVKLMLNQEEPSRVARLLRYHHYIIQAHQQKLDAYLATIEDITQVEAHIAAAAERLQKNQQQLS